MLNLIQYLFNRQPMLLIRIIAVTLCLLLAGCFQQASHTDKIDKLYHADPVKEAKAAFAAQNYKFIAVHNHHLILPLKIQECIVEKFGYTTLTNEDLKYGSYEYQKYGALSQTYANWYNYTMYEQIELHKVFRCD